MAETPKHTRDYTQQDLEDRIFATSAELARLDNARLEILALAVLHQFIVRCGAEWTRAWLRDEARQMSEIIVSRPAPRSKRA